ncbi:MAG: tetratricopeptide repeat protein [Bacteroidota bacterium]
MSLTHPLIWNRRFIPFVFSLLCFLNLSAKAVPDSLLQIIQASTTEEQLREHLEHVKGFIDNTPEKALSYSNEIISVARASSLTSVWADTKSVQSKIYLRLGRLEEMLASNQKILELKLGYADEVELATAYRNLGTAYTISRDYEQALYNYEQSLNLSEKIDNDQGKAATLHNLGVLYQRGLSDHEEALTYYTQASVLFESLGKERDLALSYFNIGLTHFRLNQPNEAEEFTTKSLKLYESLDLDNGVALCQANFGDIYTLKQDYPRAIQKYKQALQTFELLRNRSAQLTVNNKLGTIYRNVQNSSAAIFHHRAALGLAKQIFEIRGELNALNNLSEDYVTVDSFEFALKYYQDYITLKDSLNSIEGVTLKNKLVTFESERKDREIQVLEKDAVVNRQRLLIVILILLFIIIVTSGLYYRQTSLRLKEQEIFNQQKEILQLKEQAQQLILTQSKMEVQRFTQRIIEKNRLIEQLNHQLSEMSSSQWATDRELFFDRLTNLRLLTEDDWEEFKSIFNKAHPGVYEQLRRNFSSMTTGDQRLFLLIRLNFSDIQIADTLGISKEGVRKSRYRLRKKLNLERESDLDSFVLGFKANTETN